jgi:hypothetical protein
LTAPATGGHAKRPTREPTAEEREAEAIQRAFARHTPAMRGCFESAPLETTRELLLRFSIDTRGTVQQVAVTPDDIGSTTQGRCVQRIAQSIEFPPPSAPRSFRIPVEIRAR